MDYLRERGGIGSSGNIGFAGAAEIAMAEWGVTPIQLKKEWSMELLDLMIDQLIARKRHEFNASDGDESSLGFRDMMNAMGGNVQKIGKDA